MRIAATVLLLSMLAGCATSRPSAPREYLDEETAATITVVADPVVFVRESASATTLGSERPAFASEQRDYLNLYAIDVNRMGDHRQYLAVLQWLPPVDAATAVAPPTLELRTNSATIVLQPTAEQPRRLGIAKPLADSYSSSKWWYFAVDKQTLATLAAGQSLNAVLVAGGQRVDYVMWRDGRAQLAELTSALK
jgi:hypothetical protein